jgi:hypothetical protein
VTVQQIELLPNFTLSLLSTHFQQLASLASSFLPFSCSSETDQIFLQANQKIEEEAIHSTEHEVRAELNTFCFLKPEISGS